MNAFKFRFELIKVCALVNCLDDAITNAVTYTPSEAGYQVLCLVDILQESLNTLINSAAHSERCVERGVV